MHKLESRLSFKLHDLHLLVKAAAIEHLAFISKISKSKQFYYAKLYSWKVKYCLFPLWRTVPADGCPVKFLLSLQGRWIAVGLSLQPMAAISKEPWGKRMLSRTVGRRAAVLKKPCGHSQITCCTRCDLANHWCLPEVGSQYLDLSIQILLAQLFTSYKTLPLLHQQSIWQLRFYMSVEIFLKWIFLSDLRKITVH